MPVYKILTSYNLAPGKSRSGWWLNLPHAHQRGYEIQAVPIDPGGTNPFGTYQVEITRTARRLRILKKAGALFPQPDHRNDIYWVVKNSGTRTVNYNVLLVATH